MTILTDTPIRKATIADEFGRLMTEAQTNQAHIRRLFLRAMWEMSSMGADLEPKWEL